MARKAGVARRTRTDATRHARPRGKAVRAQTARRWPTGGADAWQGPHESTRTPGWHHVASNRAGV